MWNWCILNKEIKEYGYRKDFDSIIFKGSKPAAGKKEEKVKTKAKKKTYITGLHGSGSAKMKAEYRRKRANRHKNG